MTSFVSLIGIEKLCTLNCDLRLNESGVMGVEGLWCFWKSIKCLFHVFSYCEKKTNNVLFLKYIRVLTSFMSSGKKIQKNITIKSKKKIEMEFIFPSISSFTVRVCLCVCKAVSIVYCKAVTCNL